VHKAPGDFPAARRPDPHGRIHSLGIPCSVSRQVRFQAERSVSFDRHGNQKKPTRYWNAIVRRAERKAPAAGAKISGASHGQITRVLTEAMPRVGGSEAAFAAMMEMGKIDVCRDQGRARG